MHMEPNSAGAVPILRVPGWEQFHGLVAGFCGRRGGVSRVPFAEFNLSTRVGDDPDAVRHNWDRLRHATGGGLRFVTMHQVHGIAVAEVNATTETVGEADGMVSRATGLALCVSTADCVPLLLVAPRQRVIAAVHAGWRGTLGGIAVHALRRLEATFGITPADVHAALGPAIGGCCYEVDAGIADAIEARWSPLPHAITRTGRDGGSDKAMVDLRAVNREQLTRAGAPAAHLVTVGPCTRCAVSDYFSHRDASLSGQATTGRQIGFVGWSAGG